MGNISRDTVSIERKFILTAFGKNRPGIVAGIAQIIFENGCNLEDSNMGRLADEFTLILLLSGHGDTLQENLSKDCKRLEMEKDVFIFLRPLDYHVPDMTAFNDFNTITVEGIDHAGIVYNISKLLAEKNINIETLKSQKKNSPNSGTAMYSMEIQVDIPESVSKQDLDRDLDTLANELNVDILLA
ncbi:MAG: ACT domain-containing protein [Pseudomonadota bacterium]